MGTAFLSGLMVANTAELILKTFVTGRAFMNGQMVNGLKVLGKRGHSMAQAFYTVGRTGNTRKELSTSKVTL
jgi:hypothetical protein